MSVSTPFILRPVATSLLGVAVLLGGLLGFWRLAVAPLPQVDFPTIQIVTRMPGANPDIIAAIITAPLERQFGQIPALTTMSSLSSFGLSQITLQFDLDRDIDGAAQDVQSAINAASSSLPRTLPYPPTYAKVNPADTPIITLALTSDNLPLRTLSDFADSLIGPRLSEMSGVGRVSIQGGIKPAVRIRADLARLSNYKIGLEDLRQAIVAANVAGAKGALDGAHQAYTISSNDQIAAAAAYGNVIVAFRNNAPVLLRDVAEVIDGLEDTRVGGWYKGQTAIILDVQRQPGANVITTVDRLKQELPRIARSIPAGAKLDIVHDRTQIIRASIHEVEFTLALSVALVVLVVLLFLRTARATIIAGVTLPLSIVATFAVMWVVGFSLDNLSLMALTIGTGFIVDDAIVMIENISRYIEKGESPMQAALKGSADIGFTIISLTFSLIAVLIPLLFMADVVGRLFREFAITLAVSILISAVISLTLTPMMCSRMLRHAPEAEESRLSRWLGGFFDEVIRRYGVALRWVLARQRATLLVAIGTLFLTALLYVFIPKGFFPTQDTGVLQGVTEAGQDISFAAMAGQQQKVADVVLADPDVESLASFIGVDGTNATVNSGRIVINLRPLDQRKSRAPAIAARIQAKVAALEGVTLYLQPVQDMTVDTTMSRTQYQFLLQSPRSDDLTTWVPPLLEKIKALPKVKDVASDLQTNGRQVFVEIDRAAAGRYGISVADIDAVLYDALGQRIVSTIFTQSNQYRVILEVKPEFREGVNALGRLYVSTATGAQVPLSNVAKFHEQPAQLAITRVGQFPCARISFNLADGAALGDAVKAIKMTEKDLGMPASINTTFQGAAAAFEVALKNELWLILAAIVVMYIVLGVLYESFIHPVTILSTLPSAGVGALLALLLSGSDLDVIGIIGIILLIGIVKKNAIMMVDFALDAERSQGLSPEDAIYQACLLRFRPILMTTMAALLGALPLMLGSGMGSEMRQPLGITMVGGLIVSQVLTLFTTPVIYLWFDRLNRRRSGGGAGEAAATVAP